MKCSKCGLDGLDVYVNYTRGRDQVERENAELRVEALRRVTAERNELKQKVKSMQKVISGMYSGDIKKFCDGVNEASDIG